MLIVSVMKAVHVLLSPPFVASWIAGALRSPGVVAACFGVA
jgi:hypothetical protein